MADKIMYDAVDANAIPAPAPIVAGYDDGPKSKWSASDWARFPNARQVHITATGETLTSNVADVEKFDLTPDDAAGWLRRRLAAGITSDQDVPALYFAISKRSAVETACQGLTFDEWIADWTGQPHLPPSAAACQFAARGSYDETLCADFWPRETAPAAADPLIGALAYVCDDLGDQVQNIVGELRRVRAQFLGPRPS